MDIFDLRNPWYAPLWRRVVVFLVCLLWGSFELLTGNLLWAVPFLGLACLTGWVFFLTWRDPDQGDDPEA